MHPPNFYTVSDPLLSNNEACAEAGRALSTWLRDRALGFAPRPDSHNGRRPLWRRSTIRAWVASKAKVCTVAGPADTGLAALAAEAAKQASLAAQAAMAAAEAAHQAAAALASSAT